VTGASEETRFQIPRPGAEQLPADMAAQVAVQMGDTVLGEKLKLNSRRLLASFFAPPTTFKKGQKIIRERQLAGGVVS
jgi:hypothetical protein